MAAKVGQSVRDQANDNSLGNRDPLMVRAGIVGIISAILVFLVAGQWITQEQADTFTVNIQTIASLVALVLPLLTGLVSRGSVYSPRSAAKIAVENTPPLGTPTLSTSPP